MEGGVLLLTIASNHMIGFWLSMQTRMSSLE